jgi:hypothetical protein
MVSLIRCIRDHRRTAPVRFAVRGEVYHSTILHIGQRGSTEAAVILPSLGKTKLDELTADQVRKWHAGLAKARARVRIAKGATQQVQ